MPAANLVNAEKISKVYGTRTILDEVSVGLGRGDVIGVVGRNGDGKSTLLGALTGRIEPDSGRVTRTGSVSIGSLDQVDSYAPSATVREVIVDGQPDHVWAAADELFLDCLRLGGTLTGEHGVGLLKRRWLKDELGEDSYQLQREIKRVFAEGNYVIVHVHAVREPGTRGNAIFDLFRLDDNGKVLEHWDAVQPIPEPEKALNKNGMF